MRAWLPIGMLLGLSASAQTWTQLADFPGSARDDAASFTVGEWVCVGTGMDAGFQLTSDWYRYNVLTGSWASMASLPAAARQYAVGCGLEGHGYLFGGLSSSGPLNDLWRYDPVADVWQELSPLPAPGRYAATVISVSDALLICTGMLEGGAATSEAWHYAPGSDTWTMAASVPGPERHRATSIGQLIVGGADTAYAPLSDAYRYDPSNDLWTAVAPLPAPRFAADGVEALVIGGASTTSTAHADCWWYDEQNDDWTSVSLPPFAGGVRRGGVTGTNLVLMDAFMAFYGTGSDNVQRFNDWWRFDMPVGLMENATGAVRLYPVPANDLLTVETADGMAPQFLHVLNAQGMEVMRVATKAQRSTVATAHLANGTYIIRSEGAQPWQRRFVVIH